MILWSNGGPGFWSLWEAIDLIVDSNKNWDGHTLLQSSRTRDGRWSALVLLTPGSFCSCRTKDLDWGLEEHTYRMVLQPSSSSWGLRVWMLEHMDSLAAQFAQFLAHKCFWQSVLPSFDSSVMLGLTGLFNYLARLWALWVSASTVLPA